MRTKKIVYVVLYSAHYGTRCDIRIAPHAQHAQHKACLRPSSPGHEAPSATNAKLAGIVYFSLFPEGCTSTRNSDSTLFLAP